MSFYSDMAPYYDELFPPNAKQSEFLIRLLGGEGFSRVLDAGCGTGRHLEGLAEAGFSVTGLEPDPAPAAITIARRDRAAGDS